LNNGRVPTYRYDETASDGKGTKILVDGFQAKQADFRSLDDLIEYIRWYTIMGSFGNYFGSPRGMKLNIKAAEASNIVAIQSGFTFPESQLDISNGTDAACKIFGPMTVECGLTEDGRKVTVELVGALLGESLRNIVPHTYSHMGLWLSKDYIRIERANELLESIFGG
jgi:hypothetical protein